MTTIDREFWGTFIIAGLLIAAPCCAIGYDVARGEYEFSAALVHTLDYHPSYVTTSVSFDDKGVPRTHFHHHPERWTAVAVSSGETYAVDVSRQMMFRFF